MAYRARSGIETRESLQVPNRLGENILKVVKLRTGCPGLADVREQDALVPGRRRLH